MKVTCKNASELSAGDIVLFPMRIGNISNDGARFAEDTGQEFGVLFDDGAFVLLADEYAPPGKLLKIEYVD